MISASLRILLVTVAIVLVSFTMGTILKGRLPVKYALPWMLSSLVILLVGIMPEKVSYVTRLVGFEATSSLVTGVILGILLALSLILTLIVSKLNKTIILLVQEISLLKKITCREGPCGMADATGEAGKNRKNTGHDF
ncbi:MAG: DUF2304 domain-containing protein [Treponema sp.]|nr:DUF2304 domain-containing protein [Treponema sp.]